jgi:transcriptional regulator with XRE-family HTH domain
MFATQYDGAKLAAIMQAQGRRQTWLAQQVGVSVSMINHILKGRKPLTAEMAARIAVALGLPLFVLARDIHFAEKSIQVEELACPASTAA